MEDVVQSGAGAEVKEVIVLRHGLGGGERRVVSAKVFEKFRRKRLELPGDDGRDRLLPPLLHETEREVGDVVEMPVNSM